MKVLHICVAGICDKFYLTFLSCLSKKYGKGQGIFIPYATNEYDAADMQIIDQYQQNEIETVSLPIKKFTDRLLYMKKIYKYFKYLERNINIESIKISHAHSLYTDGGVSYLMKKKYNIPYIVAVRSTDTEFFMKYFPYLRWFARKIIDNAEKVIFITHSLEKSTLKRLYKDKVPNLVNAKSIVIPNGINKFWLENSQKKMKNSQNIHLIQISRLIPSKQVDKTIRAVALLRQEGFNVRLDILGTGKEKDNLNRLINELHLENSVYLRGYISNIHTVKEYYEKNDIFVMPSQNETFGLTYIEAMSQGLPVIGLKNTGVSDFFEQCQVGKFIDKSDPMLIATAIKEINMQYEILSEKCVEQAVNFDWERITEKYIAMYNGQGK